MGLLPVVGFLQLRLNVIFIPYLENQRLAKVLMNYLLGNTLMA
jgi:hypothetical protein